MGHILFRGITPSRAARMAKKQSHVVWDFRGFEEWEQDPGCVWVNMWDLMTFGGGWEYWHSGSGEYSNMGYVSIIAATIARIQSPLTLFFTNLVLFLIPILL